MITHRFKHICPDAKKLLEGVNSLGVFMRRVEKLSTDQKWITANWSPEEYKGDAFETFVEVLIKQSPIDKRLNIVNYRPHNQKIDGPDMGIDGYGRSHSGNLHTVQIKYRSNVQSVLTANQDHIANFVASTTSSAVYKDADMTVFTTAKGVNQKVNEHMFNGRVRIIGYSVLNKLVNDNIPFWDSFRTAMYQD